MLPVTKAVGVKTGVPGEAQTQRRKKRETPETDPHEHAPPWCDEGPKAPDGARTASVTNALEEADVPRLTGATLRNGKPSSRKNCTQNFT